MKSLNYQVVDAITNLAKSREYLDRMEIRYQEALAIRDKAGVQFLLAKDEFDKLVQQVYELTGAKID